MTPFQELMEIVTENKKILKRILRIVTDPSLVSVRCGACAFLRMDTVPPSGKCPKCEK